MLIVNDTHLCLAGRSSLEERCHSCKMPLAAYPLVMSDDAKQTVYHVTCALPPRHRPPGRSGDLLPSSNSASTIVCSHASRRRFCHDGMRRAGARRLEISMQSANLRQMKTAIHR